MPWQLKWAVATFYISVALVIPAGSAEESCSRFGSTHTLCRFQGISKQCKGLSRGIEKAEIGAIVALHNKARNKIAMGEEKRSLDGPMPAAGDMMELEWDDNLAAVAQRWADQCISNSHDEGREVDEFQFVGQNVATTWTSAKSSKPNWEHAFSLWYEEVKDYSSLDIKSFVVPPSQIVIGHFTQVIWANTRKVGCGYAHFTDNTFKETPFTHLYICNYGPSGNFLEGRVYTAGKPCSRCPEGTKCSSRFKGLCSAKSGLAVNGTSATSVVETITPAPVVKQVHRLTIPANSSRVFRIPTRLPPLKTVTTLKPKNTSQFNLSSLRRPKVNDITARSVSSPRNPVEEEEALQSVFIPCDVLGQQEVCEFTPQGESWTTEGPSSSTSIPARKLAELTMNKPFEPRPVSSGRYCLKIEFSRYLRIPKDLSGANITSENLLVILTPAQGKQVQVPVAPLSDNDKEWLEAKVTLAGFKERTGLTLRQSGPALTRGKIPILRSNVSIELSIGNISLGEGPC